MASHFNFLRIHYHLKLIYLYYTHTFYYIYTQRVTGNVRFTRYGCNADKENIPIWECINSKF